LSGENKKITADEKSTARLRGAVPIQCWSAVTKSSTSPLAEEVLSEPGSPFPRVWKQKNLG